MGSDKKGMNTAYVWQLIRKAVAAGHGAEAKRLADKYKVPNAVRMGLGVELSSDPKKAPKLKFG